MLVLVDTNIILDRFHRREPWYSEAAAFWGAVAAGQITAYATASSVTDLWYISRRIGGLVVARSVITDAMTAFMILPVDRQTLIDALQETGSDFEDNLQIVCARAASLDAIVTRDSTGFSTSSLTIFSPAEAVAHVRMLNNGGR